MFQLTDEQNKKLSDWIQGQNNKVVEKEMGAYYGCSGGAYTYSFTPTTLGMIVKVRNNFTKEEVDLTDYKEW